MGQEGGHLVRLDLDNSSMISSSPKSVARLIGVTVAGTPILTFVSHPASNITETISVLPEERDKIIKVLCEKKKKKKSCHLVDVMFYGLSVTSAITARCSRL